MNTLFAPLGHVLSKLCLFKPCQFWEPLPGHCCSKVLSQNNVPLKMPYLLAYNFGWGVLSIVDFARHKLREDHGLTLVTSSVLGWEAIPMRRGIYTH